MIRNVFTFISNVKIKIDIYKNRSFTRLIFTSTEFYKNSIFFESQNL